MADNVCSAPSGLSYTVRLKMDGAFPGAPDYDEYVVPAGVYDLIKKYLELMPGKEKIQDSNPLGTVAP